ncbi:N(2)-fixation sustaining protein CowN [Dechloromonas denitrificans]|uniref:N(2)-fixation sustaining protein CowN n=1 Tax=Dechloromonas denitrificans TaxID=281362 RepID=A0A133XM28_9RHOO|nr:N(2)-fixation sustaining protein CowN [Dechloromonas denitrificans]KXB31992.1 N(2)-fixation sustaining protein CowN [Dechloromonas denitrificans]
MEEIQLASADCGCGRKTDRYTTFDGIDCAGNARRVMLLIERNLPEAGPDRSFWEYFMAKRQPRSGPVPDDLFLVHSYINQIRELFESCADGEALTLLTQVEEECC